VTAFLIVLALIALLVIVTLIKSVRVVQQQTVGIVERFGKFRTGLQPGLNLLMPYVDKVRYTIDMREQVVAFPPQGVITEDNLMVSIDSVIYFQVNDPVRATYEISNYIQAIEQLTMTTLRNIIGGMDLEQTLTSREEINEKLRYVLDEATGKWGIRVNRVELRSIDPPPSIQDSMEKQMRADRDKRAAILTAEGMRQSAVLSAEGQKQSAILTAEGDKQSGSARLPVPADAAVDRSGRREQAVDRAERDRRRPQGSGQRGRPGGRHCAEGRRQLGGAGDRERPRVGARGLGVVRGAGLGGRRGGQRGARGDRGRRERSGRQPGPGPDHAVGPSVDARAGPGAADRRAPATLTSTPDNPKPPRTRFGEASSLADEV
jgi:regulator of protease activity HflC (stomatin/prohibitin superfamily)